MKRGRYFLMSIADSVSLDSELGLGIPLIEILGQNRVLIENHQGVAGYGCDQVHVKTKCGVVTISGENLQMRKLSREQLVVIGRIFAVNFCGSD